jgi:hypothetical protein
MKIESERSKLTNDEWKNSAGPSTDISDGGWGLTNPPFGNLLERALEASEDIGRRSHCERAKVGRKERKERSFSSSAGV